VTKPENIRYLSNFTSGSDARLLISSDEKYIFTDGRYLEQAKRECPDWELIRVNGAGLDSLASICDKYNSLLVESHHVTYELYSRMTTELKTPLVPMAEIIEQLRAVKDDQELDMIRQAAKIGDIVFTRICQEIQVGVSERHLANRIAYIFKKEGCSGESFETIAVAGENAALPHGKPGDRLLKRGDMLTLDFGGFYHGYAGDMTRTVVLGEASPKLKEIYQQVLEAQELGVATVKSGISCREIDRQVRQRLADYDLDQYFVHGTGHGVGLEIHETPTLSTRSEAVLEENMVVTIEPGVYIPGWGGIRIEDTVIVKNGGCEVITRSDKGLLII
jgi:Xaa-Pro aminopeptidase